MSTKDQAFIIVEETGASQDGPDNSYYIIGNDEKRDKGETRLPFRLYHDPKSLRDLLELENLKEILGHSFVFIQNRKDSSTRLFNRLLPILHLYNCIDVDAHKLNMEILSVVRKGNFPKWIDILLGRYKKMSINNKDNIIVIESGGESETRELCERISRIKTRQNGIWLRGYIWDLTPHLISLFDAIFVFDMSYKEYEILRSAIDITDDLIKDLKSSQLESVQGSVLFFLNHKRLTNGPLLVKNPVLVQT